MLKTYRIIPLVFILFLFGFTLITVAPVFAEDSPEFVACQQIKPSGDFRLMKQKKNCFRDVARSFQGQSGNSMQPVAPTDPSGGEVAELNAKIAELEAENARLLAMQTAPADPSGGEVAQLNALTAQLDAQNARLLAMQTAPAGEVAQLRSQLDNAIRWIVQVGNNLTTDQVRSHLEGM